MRTSEAGIARIADHEALRLVAYPDPASGGEPWTIGYGTTRYPDGRPVRKGDTCTREQADEWLRHHVAGVEAAVNECIGVPLEQAQFDALVSLAYNIGNPAFEQSTLVRKLNSGDYLGAAEEFPRWNKAAGRVMPGLVTRRAAERELFLSVMPAAAPIEHRTTPATAPYIPDPEDRPMPAPIVAALAKPFVIPALTVLAELIPTIGKLFNGESPSRVAERNLGAVEAIADKVLPLVVQATGAPNVQAAVEAVQANPAVAREVDEALYRQRQEFEHLAVKEARAFNERLARDGVAFWQMPAFWISVALLVPLYAVIGTVLWHSGWIAEKELRTQTVTAVLGIIGLVGAFWLGTSFGSYLKDRQREREAAAGGR